VVTGALQPRGPAELLHRAGMPGIELELRLFKENTQKQREIHSCTADQECYTFLHLPLRGGVNAAGKREAYYNQHDEGKQQLCHRRAVSCILAAIRVWREENHGPDHRPRGGHQQRPARSSHQGRQ
jgi:hypothetical protein